MKTFHNQGFTLLELLVSATLIAVLTIIGIVSYSSVNKRSRDVKRKSDLEQIRSALEMFRSDFGYYPNENAGAWNTVSPLSSDLVTNYLPSIPDDPQSPQSHYYYVPTNLDATTSNYYGYCICGYLETLPAGTKSSTCVASQNLPGNDIDGNCNYGLKNP